MPKHDQFLWKPRDGEPLKVLDMDDTHVINAVNFFRRKVAEAEQQMPDPIDFERVVGGTRDEFLCQASPQFKYVLLEGKIRGLVATKMTFAELTQMCKSGIKRDMKRQNGKKRKRHKLPEDYIYGNDYFADHEDW